MEGVSFWEWVAMYGLDGIGGGVLGGAVAALLLRQTIRHERTLRSEERESSDRERLHSLVVDSFLALNSARQDLHADLSKVMSPSGWDGSIATMMRVFFPTVVLTETAAKQSADLALHRDLAQFREHLFDVIEVGPVFGFGPLDAALVEMLDRLIKWMERPDSYARLKPAVFDVREDE